MQRAARKPAVHDQVERGRATPEWWSAVQVGLLIPLVMAAVLCVLLR